MQLHPNSTQFRSSNPACFHTPVPYLIVQVCSVCHAKVNNPHSLYIITQKKQKQPFWHKYSTNCAKRAIIFWAFSQSDSPIVTNSICQVIFVEFIMQTAQILILTLTPVLYTRDTKIPNVTCVFGVWQKSKTAERTPFTTKVTPYPVIKNILVKLCNCYTSCQLSFKLILEHETDIDLN